MFFLCFSDSNTQLIVAKGYINCHLIQCWHTIHPWKELMKHSGRDWGCTKRQLYIKCIYLNICMLWLNWVNGFCKKKKKPEHWPALYLINISIFFANYKLKKKTNLRLTYNYNLSRFLKRLISYHYIIEQVYISVILSFSLNHVMSFFDWRRDSHQIFF